MARKRRVITNYSTHESARLAEVRKLENEVMELRYNLNQARSALRATDNTLQRKIDEVGTLMRQSSSAEMTFKRLDGDCDRCIKVISDAVGVSPGEISFESIVNAVSTLLDLSDARRKAEGAMCVGGQVVTLRDFLDASHPKGPQLIPKGSIGILSGRFPPKTSYVKFPGSGLNRPVPDVILAKFGGAGELEPIAPDEEF